MPIRYGLGLAAAAVLFVVAGCGTPSEPAPSADPNEPVPTVVTAQPEPTGPTESASPKPTIKPSKDLDGISVSGGDKPKVDIPKPWAIDQTRSKALKPGDGTKVVEGGSVEINYVGVNGRTGKVFDSSYDRGQPVTFSLAQVIPGFQKGLTGQEQGSRVLMAMPGSDGYDSSGGSPQAGIEVGDTLVFVVDIVSTTLTKPTGEKQPAPSGLPGVNEAKDGKVTITIPDTPPPDKLQIAPLIKGTGKKVAEADQVTVSYVGYSWTSKTEIDAGQNETAPLGGLIEGWRSGLKGQPVGSRVELVIPPGQSYPEGNTPGPPAVAKGDTLVYVVDILYTQEQQPMTGGG